MKVKKENIVKTERGKGCKCYYPHDNCLNPECMCKLHNPQPIADWEKEFEARFGGRLTFLNERFYYWNIGFYNDVKQFISSLLLSREQEIRKKALKEILGEVVKNGSIDRKEIIELLQHKIYEIYGI